MLLALLAPLAVLALAGTAQALSAGVDTPAIQVGLTDIGSLSHTGPATDVPPSCSSGSLGQVLTVRYHAVPVGGPVDPPGPPADCDVIPSAGMWGASYVHPALGYTAAPCALPQPGSLCEPFAVADHRWVPTTFTCAPACSSQATSIHLDSVWKKAGSPARDDLHIAHDLRPVAGDDRFVELEVTFTNEGDAPLSGIQYRRTVPSWELTGPGARCQGSTCDAYGSYTVWSVGGAVERPPALSCLSNAAWSGFAPDPATCLLPVARYARDNQFTHCTDDGRLTGPKVPGPGAVTAPDMDWAEAPRGVVDCGQGTLVELAVGDLAPGQSRRGSFLLGAVRGDLAAAETALRSAPVLAEAWTVAEPATLDPTRTWATLVVGLRGLDAPRPSLSWTSADPAWAALVPGYTAGLTACQGSPVAFSATAPPSRNAIAAATWTLAPGPPTATASFAGTFGSPSHSFATPGVHAVRLDLVDDHGWPASASTVVNVIECQLGPVPSILAAQSAGTCTDTQAHFTGTAVDPDGGTITQLAWDFGDGTGSTGPMVSHQYSEDGLVTVKLTATDDTGRKASVSWPWAARADYNCVPDLVVPVHRLAAQAGMVFQFRATATDLDDVPAIEVREGPPQASIALTPAAGATLGDFHWATQEGTLPGTYLVRLVATDGKDDSSRTVDLLLTVLPRAPLDRDNDGVSDVADNCAAVQNEDQADLDHDALGNSCDEGGGPGSVADASTSGGQGGPTSSPTDSDGDGLGDPVDNCVLIPNADQADLDQDRVGDVCETDVDGDGVPEGPEAGLDNCPRLANGDQADGDMDGVGDACQAVPSATQERGGGLTVTPTGRARSAWAPEPGSWPWVIGGLGVAGLAALAWRGWRALWLVAFSRLRLPDLLLHPTRARILGLVEAQPGIHILEVARRLEGRRNTIQHHVAILAAAGLLSTVELGNRRCLYLPHEAAREVPVTSRLGAAVAAEPGLCVSTLCDQLGISHGAATYHLRRMAAQGRVQMERDGKRLRVYPG